MQQIDVLIVDDDLINRKLMSAMLRKQEFVANIVEASNGQEALEMLRNGGIGLVLLDLIMPVMDGITVLQLMEADPNLKNIPIIVLTTDETKKSEALNSGANDFISKPVRESDIIPKIKRLIEL
ncbi:MAG: response regulator [Epsilonproteobacteria bacterium]|nr:response regulator [Campylobacterota bacterium]